MKLIHVVIIAIGSSALDKENKSFELRIPEQSEKECFESAKRSSYLFQVFPSIHVVNCGALMKNHQYSRADCRDT